MNEYFGTSMSQQDLQARLAQRRRNNGQRAQSISSTQDQNGTLIRGMMGAGGDSLDDIITQNDMEIHRRQSLPQGYVHLDDDQRSSMMEFGSSNVNVGLDDFQFGVPTNSQDSNLRRQSVGGMDMASYQNMASNMSMSGHQMVFNSPVEQSNPNPLVMESPTDRFPGGMTADMVHNMMGYNQMMMDGLSQEEQSMALFSNSSYQPNFGGGNLDMMSNEFLLPQALSTPAQNISDGGVREDNNNNMMTSLSGLGVSDRPTVQIPTSMNMSTSMGMYNSPTAASNAPPITRADSSFSLPPSSTPATAAPTPTAEPPIKPEPDYNGIYSSSGFDMLGILMKVATRPNPEINIGKVDLSCAFVVCDVTMPDCPIVYVSDIFERLTGYSKYEVTGQNCRFLQSPEGKVQAGLRREFVDNDSVYYLKNRISDKKEAQRSLINYRKGGQPFMNLLTMIPICGDDSDEIKYFVGFQVDLVEKPTSVEGKNASGLYTVDYSQGQLPRYVWQPPDALAGRDLGGQTISRDDVSAVLSSVNNHTESELAKRMWDKVLLENTDDVVHVLSLKGLFLYLSPSCRHVLEYDASELVGTALSSVCHPSDIVPVTRELKDTSTGVSVNVVYRIRRKKSGYTWFESHGALSVEQGKGRKCIILVGRERPVYALQRHDVDNAGGIGESEIWTKLSTSGMFLFVSSNVRTLLDRSPEDLTGTSIQLLMRPESKIEFGRTLEKARTGKRAVYKHEIINKRGVGLQAQTTLYPGDAAEGSKPTFLVAQTRLLKTSSRTIAQPGSAHTGSSKSLQFSQNKPQSPTPLSNSGVSASDNEPTPNTMASLGIVTQAGGGGLAIGTQDLALASEDNIFDELKTTRCTSWQFELRQMEKSNRLLSEELAVLLANKKKRKRRKGAGPLQRDCANCHTRTTPEWRRGPSGQRDLCNSCGLRWAKQTGRVSPRNSNRGSGDKSPKSTSPLHKEITNGSMSHTPNLNPDPKQGLVDVKGAGGASKPKVLGGRSTVDSMPVHEQSVGFNDGGDRGITTLMEEGEMERAS